MARETGRRWFNFDLYYQFFNGGFPNPLTSLILKTSPNPCPPTSLMNLPPVLQTCCQHPHLQMLTRALPSTLNVLFLYCPLYGPRCFLFQAVFPDYPLLNPCSSQFLPQSPDDKCFVASARL